jgi:hypothetical protein
MQLDTRQSPDASNESKAMESYIGITPGTSHLVYNRAPLQASLSFLLWVGPITASLNPGATDGRCIVRFLTYFNSHFASLYASSTYNWPLACHQR